MNAAPAGREPSSISLRSGIADKGKRLDQFLAEKSGLSRSRIRQLIEQGCVQGPSSLRPSTKVMPESNFVLRIPAAKPLELEPEDIALDILYEDEDIIVINKPAGMVVHPSHGHDRGTLVHALLHHCPSLSGINGVERPGIVHRLDKDTSGCMVAAKSERAHRALAQMFARHDLHRQYLAWCRGTPGWHRQRIELAIGRHPQHRQKMAVRPQGKDAVTEAEVEALFGPFTRLRLTLHTGRTHQIRVHLSHQGLPILGDATYARPYHPGNDVPGPVRQAIEALCRQALHAEILAFAHPIHGQKLSFSAPLPADLERLDRALQQGYVRG